MTDGRQPTGVLRAPQTAQVLELQRGSVARQVVARPTVAELRPGETPLTPAVLVFLALLVVCVVGRYRLGDRWTLRRHGALLAITIAFLAWILPLMVTLRSREVGDPMGLLPSPAVSTERFETARP